MPCWAEVEPRLSASGPKAPNMNLLAGDSSKPSRPSAWITSSSVAEPLAPLVGEFVAHDHEERPHKASAMFRFLTRWRGEPTDTSLPQR